MRDYTNLPRHESYGLIQWHRIEGSRRLFGSPIEPLHFVRISIKEGHQYHGLGSTREGDGATIVELDMSEIQFAEFLTTPNRGVGTPCTLVCARSGEALREYEEPPQQTTEASLTRDEFKAAVAERMATMKSVKRHIDKLLSDGSVAEKRRREIAGEIDRLLALFTDSAPFFMKQFEENAEHVVAAAKAEITAHAELVLRTTGIAALGNVPMLKELTQ